MVPRRVQVAFELGGLVALAVGYAATESSQVQSAILITYPLCAGLIMLWRFRRRKSISAVEYATLSRLEKLESVAFILILGIVVVIVVDPVLRSVVGPWFAWWLVIVSSIEFDRVLRRRSASRRARCGRACS